MNLKSYIPNITKFNEAQEDLLLVLQGVSDYFNSSLIVRYFTKISYKGIYIYGRVGAGKSMLMQALYKSINKVPTGYLHYQSLMHNLYTVANQHFKDGIDNQLIEQLALTYVSQYKIVFIDEFEINDIASGLIVGSFIKQLWNKQVYIVITSNCTPDKLYYNGVQRDQFLPYIDLINKNMQIYYLGSDHDYRQMKTHTSEDRIIVGGKEAEAVLNVIISRLTDGKTLLERSIKVLGRDLNLSGIYAGVLVISFHELCHSNRSYNDYVCVCQYFKVIIIKNVTPIEDTNNDVVIRFINFIDNAYSFKVLVYMNSSVHPQQLYTGSKYQQPFQRSVSRLCEMNSDEYFDASKYKICK